MTRVSQEQISQNKKFIDNFPVDFWEKKTDILFKNIQQDPQNEILVNDIFMNRVHSMETLFRILIATNAFPVYLRETLSLMSIPKFRYELKLWHKQKTKKYFKDDNFRISFYPSPQKNLDEKPVTESLNIIESMLDLLVEEFQNRQLYNVLKHGFYALISKNVSISKKDSQTNIIKQSSTSPFMLNFINYDLSKENSKVSVNNSSIAISYQREMELTKVISQLLKIFFSHKQDVYDPSRITSMYFFNKTHLKTFYEILDVTNYSDLISVSAKGETKLSERYMKWIKKVK